MRYGIEIDGATYALEGQPEPATQGSWGDLKWVPRDPVLQVLRGLLRKLGIYM